MLLEELDREVEQVVAWSGRPGEQAEEQRSRRSARIERLRSRVEAAQRAVARTHRGEGRQS